MVRVLRPRGAGHAARAGQRRQRVLPIGDLFAQSARNYERADLASSPSRAERNTVLAAVVALPGPTSLRYSPSVPSAAGGSGGGPPGWSVVQHAVGYVWPNGHQDRLRRAAAAWNAAAASVDDAAVEANLPSVAFALDRLPERDDVVTVCCGVASHLQELAGVQRSLADACEQLAGHIDRVHADVEHELAGLAWQSGVIEGIGLLVSIPTVGAAELPTQGVEASRIAAVARRVASLIRRSSKPLARSRRPSQVWPTAPCRSRRSWSR